MFTYEWVKSIVQLWKRFRNGSPIFGRLDLSHMKRNERFVGFPMNPCLLKLISLSICLAIFIKCGVGKESCNQHTGQKDLVREESHKQSCCKSDSKNNQPHCECEKLDADGTFSTEREAKFWSHHNQNR